MPVFDPGSIAGILADLGVSLLSYAGIAAILYAIGGILIRTVSWMLDKMLIGLIARFYEYFEQILGGTLFTESIVEGMMNRVYLIIGVILIFRLGILLVQYIMNPAEVLEEKGGVNSLVKRAIVGLMIMIFVPTIFDIANDLSAAILKDQVIEKIIMDDETLTKVEEMKAKHGTGRVIGVTIFQGFWNIDKNKVPANVKKAYEQAEEKMDPGLVDDAGYGILHESKGNYSYDYFPILSTVVLAYVLYLVIKYCLDMVVRMLKLLILQVMAPITIVEYIINSDRNEVFKKWRTSVIANYAMLFIRVFTIWFTVWVTYLLKTGVDGESLLNTQDYLLKAIIILGLLAFMIDFPKMMSDIFGLDLEQDSAVKGVMGKAIGGMTAGLAVGGAVAGFGLKAAGGASKALKGGLHNMKKGDGLKGNLSNFASGTAATAKANHLGSALKGGLMGLGAAVMTSNSVTGSVHKGYAGVANSTKGATDKAESKEEKAKADAETRDYRQHQMATSSAIYGQQVANSEKISNIAENTEVTATQTVNIDRKLGKVSGHVEAIAQNTSTTAQQTVNIDQKLGKIENNVGQIKSNTDMIAEDTIEQTINVEQQLGDISNNIGQIKSNTNMIAEDTIQQTINVDKIVESKSSGNAIESTPTAQVEDESITKTISIDEKLDSTSSDVKSNKQQDDKPLLDE